MVGYESFAHDALPHRSWSIRPKIHFGPGLLSPNHLFLLWFLGPGLHSLAMILILTLALVSKSKGLSASTTIKSVLHSKGLKGVSNLKGMPGSTTIKQTARKYN